MTVGGRYSPNTSRIAPQISPSVCVGAEPNEDGRPVVGWNSREQRKQACPSSARGQRLAGATRAWTIVQLRSDREESTVGLWRRPPDTLVWVRQRPPRGHGRRDADGPPLPSRRRQPPAAVPTLQRPRPSRRRPRPLRRQRPRPSRRQYPPPSRRQPPTTHSRHRRRRHRNSNAHAGRNSGGVAGHRGVGLGPGWPHRRGELGGGRLAISRP